MADSTGLVDGYKPMFAGDATYPTHITEDVFTKLAEEAKYGGDSRKLMWEKVIWNKTGAVIYRSSWTWKF
jgi:hypothetical protein